MANNKKYYIDLGKLIPFLLIFSLILLIYSNTFTAEWHLDDYANIAHNPNIHIENLHPTSLSKTFKADKKISRPLARLTFALNWYIGKDNVVGYHIINILIHCITAFFLFLFIVNLFTSPKLKEKYQGSDIYFIALLSSVLWAIHPIQIQSVTYIVQRMASMAAMFYIMSMYFYLKGRIDASLKKKAIFFVLAGISFGFGLATKENTATLPIALILMEVLFFQDLNKPETRKKIFLIAGLVFIFLVIISSRLFLTGGLGSIFKGSSFRYFTPIQRLMTEARVIVFYLSEIFYPVPARFSIEHDIQVSTSLFDPWTTLPAILFLVFLVGFGILQINKRPLLSFAILFFFLNHIIESTVVGLELVFEHRNYLPSFFMFLPFSAIIKWLLDQYYIKNRVIYSTLIIFIVFMIMSFGISTYVRNIVWRTERSLLTDTIIKAPKLARPLSNLARIYYMKLRKPYVALKMLNKALKLKKTNKYQDAMILTNIGSIYYDNGHDQKAIDYYKKAIQSHPGYTTARYKLARALANSGKYKEAIKHLNKLMAKVPDNVTAPINLKGLIFMKEKKYRQAFNQFKKCLAIRKNDKNALVNIGALYYYTEDYKKSAMFFELAYIHNKNEILALLWLIEIDLMANDTTHMNHYFDTLFSSVSARGILTLPELLSDKNIFDKGIIHPPSSNLLMKEIPRRLIIKEGAL